MNDDVTMSGGTPATAAGVQGTGAAPLNATAAAGPGGARQQVGSGAPWEAIVGYSRAVRVGSHIAVAGTTATGADGEVVGVGDPYRQTRQALANIETALGRLGARMSDVVRTRLFVVDIATWEEIGRAHGETFGSIRPACSMVQVAALIDPAMLVEIEADAIVAGPGDGTRS